MTTWTWDMPRCPECGDPLDGSTLEMVSPVTGKQVHAICEAAQVLTYIPSLYNAYCELGQMRAEWILPKEVW